MLKNDDLVKKGNKPSVLGEITIFSIETAKNMAKACCVCLAVAFCAGFFADKRKKK